MPAKRSPIMDALYGEELSKVVYNRCQELGDNFNTLVQEIGYDLYWARPGLPLKEKSLVTVISLLMMNKVEQSQIQLKGFFHQGGAVSDISAMLTYMMESSYITHDQQIEALGILNTVSEDSITTEKTTLSFTGQSRDKALVDLAVHIVLGDNQQTEQCMRTILSDKSLSEKDIENVMIHQGAYCGFPCAMNGYAVLKTIRDNNSQN